MNINDFKLKLCEKCGTYMVPHKTIVGYLKCHSCGYQKMEKPIITLENYITANNRYPKRLIDPEYTKEVQKNANKLLDKVNALLHELGIKSVDITSGFRPSGVNSSTTNAAKKSYHMRGMAIDILDDKQQNLGNLIKNKPELLKKYGLWMEDLSHTIGKNTNWVHLDIGERKDREIRIFIP